MTGRLSRQRWWIALLYGVAAVLAQGFHSHDAPSKTIGRCIAAATCGGDHAGSAADANLSDGPAVRSGANDCPSCEFSLSHQATPTTATLETEAVRPSHPVPSTPTGPDTAPVRTRCRAPPLLV